MKSLAKHVLLIKKLLVIELQICLTSVTRVKCGVRSTLCWKTGNISGSTELFNCNFRLWF